MRDRQDDSTYKAPRAELSLATDFELRSRLGDGSYSTVFRALYKGDGKEYAIKVIDKYHVMRHKMVDYVKRERDVLDRLNHDGVARLHFTFQDKINLYMALELCPNGELLEQITQRGNRMDLETTRFYAAEVVDILEYLRANVVIHRDIKPENLMLNERGHLKLIDFGSVRDLSVVVPGAASPPQDDSSSGSGARAGDASRPERRLSFIGTADYIAPEVLSPGEASYALDLWALGCVIYQMMVGRPPFRAATEFLTFQRIKECTPVYPDHIPDVAKDIISKLLVEQPAARLGANDLEELKCHPFFSGIDWNGLRLGDAPDVLGNPGQIAEGAKHDWEMLSLLKALPTDAGEDNPSPSSSRQ